jgi:hypothetical protein
MDKIVHVVFSVAGDGDGYLVFEMEHIFETLEMAVQYCRNEISTNPPKKLNDTSVYFGFPPDLSTKGYVVGTRNDFGNCCTYSYMGFLIEPTPLE